MVKFFKVLIIFFRLKELESSVCNVDVIAIAMLWYQHCS